MRDHTLPLSHFEAIYRRGDDPWGFATSDYERQKYLATLAALPHGRYRRGLEVGCSIGVFTAMLADRCDDLLAVEPVATALDAARRRNAGRPHLRFAPLFIPAQWPDEDFDLVVLSEVLDYLGEGDLMEVAHRLERSLRPEGDVVLVHWIGKKRASALASNEASDRLVTAARGFTRIVHQSRNRDYRLDVLTRA